MQNHLMSSVTPVSKMEEEKLSQELNEVPLKDTRDTAPNIEILVPISTKLGEVQSPYVRFLSRYPKLVLLGFLVATIGIAIYAIGVFQVLGSEGFNDPTSESAQVSHYFKRFDNVSSSSDLIFLVEHPTWYVDDADYQNAYFDLKEKLESEFPLSKIQSYFDYPNESGGMVSLDRHMAIITAGLPEDVVEYEGKPKYTADDFDRAASDSPLTVTFGGSMLSNEEVNEQIAKDLEKLEFGAFPVLIVLLIFAHEGIVAVSVPILLTIWTVLCTFAALRLVSLGFNVTTYATNVTTVFGTGLAMDFSLFAQLRFQEELHRHRDDPDYTPAHAVEKMLVTSGKTVIFSCIMIVCTMVAALQFSEYFITTMSLAILFPGLFAAIGTLTFVPALFIALGRNLFLLSTKPLVDGVTNWMRRNDVRKGDVAPVPTNEEGAKKENDGDIELGAGVKQGKNAPETEAATIATAAALEQARQEEQSKETDTDAADQAGPDTDPQQKYTAVSTTTPSTDAAVMLGGPSPEDIAAEVQKREATLLELEEDRKIRSGIWFRIVYFVMEHPLMFFLGMLGCLVALMVVFFTQARFANQAYGNLPLDSPSRYIIETTLADFPKSNGDASLEVYMQTKDPLGMRSATFLTMMDSYCKELLAYTPYVVDVTSITTIDDTKTLDDYIAIYGDPYADENREFSTLVIDPYALTNLNDVVRVHISLSIAASDEDLGKVVRYVRRLTASAFIETQEIGGEDTQVQLLHYWGTAGDADQYDLNRDIAQTIPQVIAVVLPCVFIFILLLTGSLLMPVKAIVTTFLSLCASFGFLVLIIQEGNGSDLLEFRNNLRCLDPLQMIFIFLVAFGLSLDYELFMLGRIQEIYSKTGDNKYAVARGVETSSRSVTMAALLLCTAVGGFLASEILLLKQIGVGIGLTIVIDATFVRCILVPAAMGVIGGEWNWWAPKPIKQLVERIGLRETE